MSKKIKTEAAKRLFQAILTLETEEECFTFFEDLCTVNELESLAQRFEVASMLRENIHIWKWQKRRSIHGYDQQGQPFFKLRKRRI